MTNTHGVLVTNDGTYSLVARPEWCGGGAHQWVTGVVRQSERVEKRVGGIKQSMNERDTRNRIAGYADAVADCIKVGYVNEACGVVMLAAYCTAAGREKEKGSGNVGPHSHARDTQGCACQQDGCPHCYPGTSATHHATQPTQVPGNTAHDATSHG